MSYFKTVNFQRAFQCYFSDLASYNFLYASPPQQENKKNRNIRTQTGTCLYFRVFVVRRRLCCCTDRRRRRARKDNNTFPTRMTKYVNSVSVRYAAEGFGCAPVRPLPDLPILLPPTRTRSPTYRAAIVFPADYPPTFLILAFFFFSFVCYTV